LLILTRDNNISKDILPAEFQTAEKLSHSAGDGNNLVEIVNNVEIISIKNALTSSDGNKNKAAEILGIPVSTLRSKMEKYGLLLF